MSTVERKPHLLRIKNIDEGRIYSSSIECPYEDMGKDRPCALLQEIVGAVHPDLKEGLSEEEYEKALEEWEESEHPGWETVEGCWVQDFYGNVGSESIGSLKVDITIPVDYRNEGSYDESTLTLIDWREDPRYPFDVGDKIRLKSPQLRNMYPELDWRKPYTVTEVGPNEFPPGVMKSESWVKIDPQPEESKIIYWGVHLFTRWG